MLLHVLRAHPRGWGRQVVEAVGPSSGAARRRCTGLLVAEGGGRGGGLPARDPGDWPEIEHLRRRAMLRAIAGPGPELRSAHARSVTCRSWPARHLSVLRCPCAPAAYPRPATPTADYAGLLTSHL